MHQHVTLLGLNHKTAAVEVRESFALGEKPELGRRIIEAADEVRECFVLSTCNRVEIAAVTRQGLDPADRICAIWAENLGRSPERLRPHLYVHRDLDAVRHVFRVASGLDSLVLGEPQILGQLKAGYRHAVETGTAGVIVNRMLHKAFTTAKRVRTATGIGASAVSVSSAAVELAKRIFGEMSGKKALLIGAGEMAELAATHLLAAGVAEILVANRTYSRAEELAARFRGRATAFETFVNILPEVDIVISSTGAPQVILRARDLREVLKKRRYKPMFFIDIAVPRDIDPDINGLDNVFLYDIDDLREVVEENLAQRQEEAARAEEIVSSQVEGFGHWLKSLDLAPTIVDLLHYGEDIALRELRKTLKRLGPDVSEETTEALRTLSLSISRKMLHEPIGFLKRRTREDSGERFVDLTRRIFNLDREKIPDEAHGDRKRSALDDEDVRDDDPGLEDET